MAESRRLFSIWTYAVVFVSQIWQKAKLGRDAKVWNGEIADFFENRVPWKLKIDFLRRIKVMNCQWCDLHYVTDIEQIKPLTLIQVAQENLHINSVF